MHLPQELEELRVGMERIRTLLENLVVRGLRACGPDELAQIGAFAEHLELSGAGHLASLLAELRRLIESDDRTSARKLLQTQTNVRLLERLLTLRVVQGHYATAIEGGGQVVCTVEGGCQVADEEHEDDEDGGEED
jgi:hypothetical protein